MDVCVSACYYVCVYMGPSSVLQIFLAATVANMCAKMTNDQSSQIISSAITCNYTTGVDFPSFCESCYRWRCLWKSRSLAQQRENNHRTRVAGAGALHSLDRTQVPESWLTPGFYEKCLGHERKLEHSHHRCVAGYLAWHAITNFNTELNKRKKKIIVIMMHCRYYHHHLYRFIFRFLLIFFLFFLLLSLSPWTELNFYNFYCEMSQLSHRSFYLSFLLSISFLFSLSHKHRQRDKLSFLTKMERVRDEGRRY